MVYDAKKEKYYAERSYFRRTYVRYPPTVWHIGIVKYLKNEGYSEVRAICGYKTSSILGEAEFSYAKAPPKRGSTGVCQECQELRAAADVSDYIKRTRNSLEDVQRNWDEGVPLEEVLCILDTLLKILPDTHSVVVLRPVEEDPQS